MNAQEGYERGYRKALRDVQAWMLNHTYALGKGKQSAAKKLADVIGAFVADAETFSKYGDMTEVCEIGGKLTIDRERIRIYEEGVVAAAKASWSHIPNADVTGLAPKGDKS